MPEQDAQTLEAMNADVDNAVRMSLRKPAAALAVGVVMITGGAIDSVSEQPQADHLAALVDDQLDDLTASERAVVSDFLLGEDLPEDAEPSLVKAAQGIDELSNKQKEKDNAGQGLIFAGTLVSLWSAVKIGINKSAGSMRKERLREVHPDLASQRLERDSLILFTAGYSLESTSEFARKHRTWRHVISRDEIYETGMLQDIGRDLETSCELTPDRSQLERVITEQLNQAQWDTLRESVGGTMPDVSEVGALELYKVDLMGDLWQPENTFTSLTDWYEYRRRQIVTSQGFHRIDVDDLFLPELETRSGGIGIALGRVANYVRLMEKSSADHEASGNAMLFATEGARILDRIAPRDDGVHWFDYVQDLERSTSASAEM